MQGKPKKGARHKDVTGDYLRGAIDEDRVEQHQRFSSRNKNLQANKTLRTSIMRAEEQAAEVDPETLPLGTVVQVYSLFSEVEHGDTKYRCVVRKTLAKVSDTQQVVGDLVRFRIVEGPDSSAEGSAQGVIEAILPRKTVLARSDSFKGIEVHPIVANAEQMLIVASVHQPEVKWGLVDRMIVAAQSGGVKPIVCLNKIDLIGESRKTSAKRSVDPDSALAHYGSLGISTMRASVVQDVGIDEIRALLLNRVTVLAGHSGVGKSSLIQTIQPALDLRIGEVSGYTNKGRHTTTFARRYKLDMGGHVIDTPGVKLFGLWNVTGQNLIDYFPDVGSETAPEWRRELPADSQVIAELIATNYDPRRVPGNRLLYRGVFRVAKSEPIEVEATVSQALPNAMFKLRLDNSDREILGIVSGKMRKHFIRILPGDRVKVELSPYDLTRGRIVFRQK